MSKVSTRCRSSSPIEIRACPASARSRTRATRVETTHRNPPPPRTRERARATPRRTPRRTCARLGVDAPRTCGSHSVARRAGLSMTTTLSRARAPRQKNTRSFGDANVEDSASASARARPPTRARARSPSFPSSRAEGVHHESRPTTDAHAWTIPIPRRAVPLRGRVNHRRWVALVISYRVYVKPIIYFYDINSDTHHVTASTTCRHRCRENTVTMYVKCVTGRPRTRRDEL